MKGNTSPPQLPPQPGRKPPIQRHVALALSQLIRDKIISIINDGKSERERNRPRIISSNRAHLERLPLEPSEIGCERSATQ